MRVRLTEQAKQDLRWVYAEGLRLFGQKQADRYFEGLSNALDFIGEFPEVVRLRDELKEPIYAYRYQSHLILYLIREIDVLVVRIRHGREDWQDD